MPRYFHKPALAGLVAFGLLAAIPAQAWSPGRCSTPERRHRVWRLPLRPPSAFSLSSSRGFPLRILGPAGTEAVAARIRDAADRAWQAEIVEGGWPAPPADVGGPDPAYDFYVDSSQAQGEAYTQPEDAVTTVTWDAQTSFIGLPDSYANDQELFSIVAHELNHASQFAIDSSEDDAFFEHTSVFMEWAVAHHVPTYSTGIDAYQAHPERPLNYMGSDLYEYGAGVWLIFLSERYDARGQGLVQRLWTSSKQATGVNEPDFLDALSGVATEKGTDVGQMFATLASWRFFTGPRDDGLHFADGAAWGSWSQVTADPLSVSPAGTLQVYLSAFGAALRTVDLPAGMAALEVTVSGEGGVAAIVPLTSAGKAAAEPTVVSAGSGAMRVEFPSGSTRAVVAVTYAPAGWDPDLKDWSTHQVTTRVAAVTAEPPDAGTGDAGGDTPPPPAGCHCASGGGEPAMWVALLAALAWAAGQPRGPRVSGT